LVVCSDLIAPEGYGEIIGGGVCSIDATYMLDEIEKSGLDFSTLDWYFDLVRYGNPPHAGFGMGLERVVAWITKADSIIETTMYPRTRDILKC
jgi:asparaginyl-tRNA synthetase